MGTKLGAKLKLEAMLIEGMEASRGGRHEKAIQIAEKIITFVETSEDFDPKDKQEMVSAMKAIAIFETRRLRKSEKGQTGTFEPGQRVKSTRTEADVEADVKDLSVLVEMVKNDPAAPIELIEQELANTREPASPGRYRHRCRPA